MTKIASKRPAKGLALLSHAITAARPRTRAEALACNASLSRARDFLMHEPARDIATGGVAITAGEFEALRRPALAEMRARCHSCGLCSREQIPLP